MATPKDPLAPQSHARGEVRPDGRPYLSLDLEGTGEFALALGASLGEAERLALKQGVIPERYVRMLDAFGVDDLYRILSSRVAIIGLGGLGGHVLDILARSGVLAITGADGDRFETSNLNRQLLSAMDTLDQPKAQAAAEHVARINPAVDFTPVEEFLTETTMRDIFAEVDVAVDCLGGLDSRLAAQRAAAAAGIPLVTAALAGWSGYAGSVFPGRAGPAELLPEGGSAAEDSLGCPGPTVAFAASLQAREALRIVAAEKPEPAPFLFFDLASGSFDTVRL